MHDQAIRFSLASSDVPPSIKGWFSAENERAAPCRCPQSYSWFRCYRNPDFVARIEGKPDDLRAAAFTLAGICKIPVAAPRSSGRKVAPGAQEERKAGPAPKPRG